MALQAQVGLSRVHKTDFHNCMSCGSEFFTFIFLRATSLSYDVAHRTVRSWRQNSFRYFLRWPWNTLSNRMCGVTCCRKEWGGSFQQYFYKRYKIVVYTGLRSDSIKNHTSRNERNDSLYYEAYGIIVSCWTRVVLQVWPIQISMTLKSKGMLNTLNSTDWNVSC
jgi:hypothetical protein